jgi:drug/metabolite transporter (DMT)-like permease
MIALGVAAGLAASAAYNGGIVLQAIEARDSPRDSAMRLSLIVALCRRRRWLAGVALSILGFPLQIYAYANAPIAVVQTCLAAGLVLVMLCGARVMGEAVRGRDYLAVAAITTGVGLTAVAAPTRSEIERAGSEPAIVLAVLGALALIPYLLARRGLIPALIITASAGVALAWNDIATKLFGNAFEAGTMIAAGLWLVAIVCSALIATVSEMSALQRVRATKVVPTVFVLETFIPILVGPLLLKTHLPLAPASQVVFFGGLVLVLVAIVVIARSDPVTSVVRQGADETRDQIPVNRRRPSSSPRRPRRGRTPEARPASPTQTDASPWRSSRGP